MRRTRQAAALLALVGLLAATSAPSALAAGGFSRQPRTQPLGQASPAPAAKPFTYSDLLRAAARHQVVSAKLDDVSSTISVVLKDGRHVTTTYPAGDSELLARLTASGATVSVVHPSSSNWLAYLTVLPLALAALGFVVFMTWRNWRQTQGSSRQRQASLSKEATTSQAPVTRFAQVAGIDEAVEELEEMVDFLKHPEKYSRLGARLPNAVMLYGPPGTGKTLLAKALAGEAGVPFYAVSASEFVEMYVGVGAKRIRELFRRAKSHKEGAVVFIDEIDAIGRKRGGGQAQTNDEREQTLNQLLVELDGFSTSARVIVVAATNRLDVLDPALLRPGRFGRQIAVDLPSEAGRGAILAVHTTGKPVDAAVDLASLARITGGLSGAQLAEVVNEAALMAARNERQSITQADFDEGILRVLMGPEKRSSMLAEGELEVIAYHEAGHVLTAELCPTHEKAQRATVRPRGRAAGLALYGRNDRALSDAAYIHEQMVCALGGRAAEQVVFGKVSSGAANDLGLVNQLARRAIEELGLSRFGQMVTQPGEARVSEETLAAVDREVQGVVDRAYNDAVRLLQAHRPQLDKLAALLLSQGDLERVDIQQAIAGVEAQQLEGALAARHERQEAERPAAIEALPAPQLIQEPFRRGLLERALNRGAEWAAGRHRRRV